MIGAGSYRLAFPVKLPEVVTSLPVLNLWRLTLCADRWCMSPQDPSVIASFPMAGFLPGEVSLLELKRIQAAVGEDSHAVDRQSMSSAVMVVLLVQLSVFSMHSS